MKNPSFMYDAVIRDHEAVLYKLCLNIFPEASYDDLQDYMQIARMATCKAVDTYDASRGAQFKTFLISTVRNALLDEYRLEKKRAEIPVSAFKKESFEADFDAEFTLDYLVKRVTPSFSETEEETEVISFLDDAYAAATGVVKIGVGMVRVAYIERRDPNDVAGSIEGLSPGTARVYLSRGKKFLRERYNAEF